MRYTMSAHEDDHGHQEDNSVNVKVGVFFIAVLATIILLGLLR